MVVVLVDESVVFVVLEEEEVEVEVKVDVLVELLTVVDVNEVVVVNDTDVVVELEIVVCVVVERRWRQLFIYLHRQCVRQLCILRLGSFILTK